MAEILKEEQAAELAAEIESQGKDPRTELVFDVDWIIKVEAGSMAEIDKANDLAAFDSTIQMAQSLGVPIDNKRAWIERAIKAGIKEPENLISNEMPQSPQAQQNPLEQQMQPPNMTPKPNSV